MINEVSEIRKNDIQKYYQITLIVLLISLVFEGVFRKILPGFGMLLFFIKDICCLITLILYLKDNKILWVNRIVKILFLIILPLFFYTGFYDPLIALFGLKQYVLYIFAMVLIVKSFSRNEESSFKILILSFNFLLIVTCIVAIVQSNLPSTHWLNKSVDGNDLSAFGVDGVLRVSSTFPFTAQYSFYIVFAFAILFVSYFYIPQNFWIKNVVFLILCICVIVSMYITGGRTAVLGVLISGCIGTILIILRVPYYINRIAISISIIFLIFIGLKSLFPNYFIVYEKRQEGDAKTNELQNRVLNSYILSNDWYENQNLLKTLLGNGIGVMSNGTDKFSDYAKESKKNGFWTESDFQTSLWEGGLYLIFTWYFFRFGISLYLILLFFNIKNKFIIKSSAILLGYIILNSILGALSIQNTVAIWWWLAIGVFMLLVEYDKQKELKYV